MKLSECSVCRLRPPIYVKKSSGMAYCRPCLRQAVDRAIRRVIRKLELLSPTDAIAIAIRPSLEDLCFLSLFLELESEFRLVKVNPLLVAPNTIDFTTFHSIASSLCIPYWIKLSSITISPSDCLSCISSVIRAVLEFADLKGCNKAVIPLTLDEYCSLALAYIAYQQHNPLVRTLLASALPQASNRNLALPAIEVLSIELTKAVQIPIAHQCPMKSSSMIGELRRLLLKLEFQRAGSLIGLLRTLQKIGNMIL